MSQGLDPACPVILVETLLRGPMGEGRFRLVLDTGATFTIISSYAATILGYDPDTASEKQQITTASGVEHVPRIMVEELQALGQERPGFPVLCHTLPPSARVDGLLGLDFLRGRRLVLDFRKGLLSLE